jgi:hypothetical protein
LFAPVLSRVRKRATGGRSCELKRKIPAKP